MKVYEYVNEIKDALSNAFEENNMPLFIKLYAVYENRMLHVKEMQARGIKSNDEIPDYNHDEKKIIIPVF